MIHDPPKGYQHPTTVLEFEEVYQTEYEQELASCDKWIGWCKKAVPKDTHGINFHEGMRAALVFNNIKMCQLLRVLKQEPPNASPSHRVLLPKTSERNFLTPEKCAAQFELYAKTHPSKDSQHSLNFCANFIREFCILQPHPNAK